MLAASPCLIILSWAMGSLIDLLKSSNLGLAMYGKHGGGGGACAILALYGEWWVVAFGGGVSTNNELVNATHSKEVEEGDFLLHLCGGVGGGSIPPTIEGMLYIQREHQCAGNITIVKMAQYLNRREHGMVHNKMNVFPNF